VFDHLVWERYHYQDVLEVRKYGETGILFKVVNPTKKELEDIELIFDFNDKKLRAGHYKVYIIVHQILLCAGVKMLPEHVLNCYYVSECYQSMSSMLHSNAVYTACMMYVCQV
jgi:hypothetical protein